MERAEVTGAWFAIKFGFWIVTFARQTCDLSIFALQQLRYVVTSLNCCNGLDIVHRCFGSHRSALQIYTPHVPAHSQHTYTHSMATATLSSATTSAAERTLRADRDRIREVFDLFDRDGKQQISKE